jgi:hypothetical protein
METKATTIDIEVHLYKSSFFGEVGIVDIFTLRELGLSPDTGVGMFCPSQLEELKDFCEKNPQYHVISTMRCGTMLNRPRIGAHHHFLGRRNSNPKLVYKPRLD